MTISISLPALVGLILVLLVAGYFLGRWLQARSSTPLANDGAEPAPPAPRPSGRFKPPPAVAGPVEGVDMPQPTRAPPTVATAPSRQPADEARSPEMQPPAAPMPRRPTVAPPPAAASSTAPRPLPPAGARPATGPAATTSTPRSDAMPAPPSKPVRTAAPPPAAAIRIDGQPTPPSTRPAAAAAAGRKPAARSNPLAGVTSWGYQLQKLSIERAAQSPFDLLVIDYSRDGTAEKALKPADLDRIRTRANGAPRKILAYLSIGEAESYRYYWNADWKTKPPAWLLGENPEWQENYAVCFWDPDWQRHMCGSPDAYLDRIIAAGFDGVYLDKCDVYEDLRQHHKAVAAKHPDLEQAMVRFIATLSEYAKARRPDFAVVMQNAESLLDDRALVSAIDGVAKEELLFGVEGGEGRNAKDDVAWSTSQLAKAAKAGKAVLVVEYLDDLTKIREAAATIREAGFVPYFAPKDRELDRLNYKVLDA